MSRIGKQPINIPDGVNVTVQDGSVDIKGPNGNLNVKYHADMIVKHADNQILVTRPTDAMQHRALHGTTRQIIANGVKGVSEGFSIDLEIIGVGYQANMQGKRLVLQLGYSHDIIFDPPEGIKIEANRTTIKVFGFMKELVGEVAAKIRSFRKPEPYKGKGIRYKGEYVRHKQGKTVGGTD